MSSLVSENQPSQEDRSVVWLISFGDLLTLLVCLFLVITPWDKLNCSAKPLNIRGNEVSSVSRQFRGIPIATSAIKQGYGQSSDTRSARLVSEIPLWRLGSGNINGEAEADVTRSLSEEISAVKESPEEVKVTVRLCDKTVDRSRVLEAVHEVLGKSEVKAASVAVQLDGARCDEVAVLRPVTQGIVGTVRLEGI